MLTIDWPNTESQGFIDYIPMGWFASEGTLQGRTHPIRTPRNTWYPARCDVTVYGPIADMQYGGRHSNFNDKHGAYLGVLRIAFDTEAREHVTGVLWKNTGARQFRNIGAVFALDNSSTDQIDDLVAGWIGNDTTIESTTKQVIIAARRGQGRFRKNVEQIEGSCRLTGVSDGRFLRASHMKPWWLCENNHERLDGYNGLLLTPNADHLFDRGFISFEDDGTLLISKHLEPATATLFGLDEGQESRPFRDQHKPYLAYHRSEVFLG
jgi:hypothetical protein